MILELPRGMQSVKKRNGVRVDMKTYNLEEVDALRKKFNFAYLDPSIYLADEASTVPCISVGYRI